MKKVSFIAMASLFLAGCAGTQIPSEMPTAYMIFFAPQAATGSDHDEIIAEVTAITKKYPTAQLRLIGHRSRDEAVDLDELRVNAVLGEFIDKGVPPEKVVLLTAEDTAPIATVPGKQSAANSRVEIYLVTSSE